MSSTDVSTQSGRCLWKGRSLQPQPCNDFSFSNECKNRPLLKLIIDEKLASGPDAILQAIMKYYKTEKTIPSEITIENERILLRKLKPEGDEALVSQKLRDLRILSSNYIGTIKCIAVNT
eukprot:GHVH01009780.1.p1 GENE.GHVH01009780.1~~GHVH01009780.1.p1  ORF type:complete len:141 (+),score=17.97 GHVH01009780.1:66-425(+)